MSSRADILERLAAGASGASVAEFLRREAQNIRDGVSGEGDLRRIGSEAFYTPELDEAIYFQLTGPLPRLAALPPGQSPKADKVHAPWFEDWRARKRAKGEWFGS